MSRLQPRETRLNRAEVAQVVLRALSNACDDETFLSDVAQAICAELNADRCDILVSDENSLVLRASTSCPDLVGRCRIAAGVGICGHVFVSGERIVAESELCNHKLFANYPEIDDESFASAVTEPIVLNASAVGVIFVRKFQPWRPQSEELQTIEEFAQSIGLGLRAHRNAYDAGAKLNRLGALSEAARTIGDSPYLEEVLQLLVNITAQQFNYTVCTVRLLDEENQELVLRATQSQDRAYRRKRAIKLGESIAGRAIAANRSIIISDVQQEADYVGHDLAVEQGLRSMICIPLKVQDRIVGVMSCYTSAVREFPDDEVRALETLAKQAAVSIEHAKLQVRHTLMQEMHHRVKNNLQQVVSLLRLQIRHGSYKSLEDGLNDTLGRILAIAGVHDLLSREDLDHVDMDSVAETLVQSMQHSIIMPSKKIRFQVRGDRVRLNMTQATQVALILNELLQNSLEHGFAVSDEGEIHITVEDREGEVRLWVSNDGDALATEFDLAERSGLGLQVVSSLARSLGGAFKMSTIDGWTVSEVRFTRLGSE